MRDARLVHLPDVITSIGKYRTRNGEIVNIKYLLKSHLSDSIINYGHGHYANGIPETWDKSGRIFGGQLSNNDIVAKEEISL